MRILLVQRHFWPDVSVTASMGRALAARLTREGHEVTVLSSMPSYNEAYTGSRPPRRERLDGFRLIRLRLPRERKGSLAARLSDTVAFAGCAASLLLVRGRRYDLIITGSAPPVALAAVVRMVTRLVRRPFVYHCQDLNPEAALISGVLRRGWLAWLLARMDRHTMERAAAVIVLSSDMASALYRRGLDGSKVRIIRDFTVVFSAPMEGALPQSCGKPRGTFRVLFAGNLGLVQGLDVVLGAARRLREHRDIQFMFLGAGVYREEMERQAGPLLGETVFFCPQQPLPVALRMMEEADVGLVSLAPDIFRVAFPSKTMAYLAAGCPVLAVVEAESELAALVEKAGVGSICSPGDPAALAEAILRWQAGCRAEAPSRAQIRAAYEQYFGAERALGLWVELVRELGGNHSGGLR